MPKITINGRECEFEKGESILDVALAHDVEIPYYCYHPGLTAPANCRICLAEVFAPNPKKDGKLEPMPKLLPTCRTPCGEGQVVRTDTPKAIANQKAVMEYLLINHPVDCAVCDQAGECYLQDYSYQFGRGYSRFQEAKNKQPKKDVGKHVLLYSDRCIMCTRCVRFTEEITGTGELMVMGRGSTAQIDVFPGKAVDNELSGNVIDICPVGALLDKEFLFAQRVWFLTETPSIDPLTSSGDNIKIEHNDGKIYRVTPRTNMDVNTWWITDEVRYGWGFVHDAKRLHMPAVRGRDPFQPLEAPDAYRAAYAAVNEAISRANDAGGRVRLLLSPMLSCEDAFHLASFVREAAPDAVLALGPVPVVGEDKTFPSGFTVRAEKAPNARGVRRVLNAFGGSVLEFNAFLNDFKTQARPDDVVILTGNHPSNWATEELIDAVGGGGAKGLNVARSNGSSRRAGASPARPFLVLIDTLATPLVDLANVLIPAATWAEKAGTFENVNNRLQAFERAIEPVDFCKSEAQIALDLAAFRADARPAAYNARATHATMARRPGLEAFASEVHFPTPERRVQTDMPMVEL